MYEAIEREHVNFRVPILDDVLKMLAKNFDSIMSDDLQCYTLRKSPHLMQQVIERVRGSQVVKEDSVET